MPIFTAIPHDHFVADVLAIAAALQADTDWRPNFLIGIGRGGLTPAVYLSHATGIAMLSIDHGDQAADLTEARLRHLAARSRAGANLLIVDDINDSGRTISELRTALAAAGADLARLRFATLIDNVTSTERVDYRARVIDRTVTKDWFVFPWEAIAPASSIAADAAEVPDRIA